jgi:hypothetical protein
MTSIITGSRLYHLYAPMPENEEVAFDNFRGHVKDLNAMAFVDITAFEEKIWLHAQVFSTPDNLRSESELHILVLSLANWLAKHHGESLMVDVYAREVRRMTCQ